MAPEQAAGRGPLDARTDLYGLGGVAYFLLTGRPPFDCDSALQLVLAHACDPVMPPGKLRPEVPADLEAVVMRCLEKVPAGRFATAAEVERALAACACAAQAPAPIKTHYHHNEAPTLMQGS
jgi:serine/threonine-protein kinase